MLGWQVYINRRPTRDEFASESSLNDETLLATWVTGINGLDWLRALVKSGQASDLGGTGYPHSYTAEAKVLLPLIASLPKKHSGPIVIGDDYVHLGGFNESIKIHQARIDACPVDEVLSIEAWDQG